MQDVKLRLQEIYAQVKNGKSVEEPVKNILSWFGWSRRGVCVNARIKDEFTKAGLQTYPDFEDAYIYGNLKFEKLSSDSREEDESLLGSKVTDPVPRVQLLASANKPPTYVNPEDSLQKAKTIMLINDFSQLPVMQSDRDVSGIITWASIAGKMISNGSCNCNEEDLKVKDFSTNYIEIISDETPLLEAVPKVIKDEVILVRNKERKICGLITTSDISFQFQILTEPFLLTMMIENHIRKIIDYKFKKDEVKAILGNRDERNEIQFSTDLTFGEYIRIIEKPENWERLSIGLDRCQFIQRLNYIRTIRNDIMHFHPDGLSDEALQVLRETATFLERIRVKNCFKAST